MAAAVLQSLAVAAHRLRVVVPMRDLGGRKRMSVELTDVLGRSAPERLWEHVSPTAPGFFGSWLQRRPAAADNRTLTASTLHAWGVPEPTGAAGTAHAPAAVGAVLFRLSQPALTQLIGATPERLLLSLHDGARQRLRREMRPVYEAVLSPPQLRWFGSGLGHLELDLVLTGPVETADLLEFLAGLECALREPSKLERIRLGAPEGPTLDAVLKRLQVDGRQPLSFLAERAYTVLGVQLAASTPPLEVVAEWTERLARRHNLDHRYGDRESLRLAIERRRFEGIHEVVAAEGAAQLQWNSGGGEPSRWFQNYFTDSWPVSVLVPISVALHERQFLQRLSDETEGPGAGERDSHHLIEKLSAMRKELVCYRLDKRIIECSTIDHVQARFEQARRTFRLEPSLAILEGDLASGHAQLEEAWQKRWRGMSALLTGAAVVLLVLHVGEATVLAWTEHQMDRVFAEHWLSAAGEKLKAYQSLYDRLSRWSIGLLVGGLVAGVAAAVAILRGAKTSAGH